MAGFVATTTTVLVALLATSPVFADDRSAQDLRATTDCDDTGAHQPTARLAWHPAQAGGEQKVEVTTARDGFDVGKLEASQPLPADAATLAWTALRGRSSHYWRVVTRHGDDWVASDTARFTPPRCGERLVMPPILPPSGSARSGTESAVPPSQHW